MQPLIFSTWALNDSVLSRVMPRWVMASSFGMGWPAYITAYITRDGIQVSLEEFPLHIS